jgi:hypothetical protein
MPVADSTEKESLTSANFAPQTNGLGLPPIRAGPEVRSRSLVSARENVPTQQRRIVLERRASFHDRNSPSEPAHSLRQVRAS